MGIIYNKPISEFLKPNQDISGMAAKGLVHAAHLLNATFLQPILCYVSHQPNAHFVFVRGFQVVVGQLGGEA